MKILIWIAAIFILLVLQAGVLVPLHLGTANLILVLMVLVFLSEGWDTALMVGLIGGLMLDGLSGNATGMITMSLLLVLIVMHLMFEAFLTSESGWLITFVSVAGLTWIFGLLLLGFNWLFNLFHVGVALNLKSFLFNQFIVSLILNLVFTYPVAKYLQLVNKATHEQSIRNQ
jgi:hypothetical protein